MQTAAESTRSYLQQLIRRFAASHSDGRRRCLIGLSHSATAQPRSIEFEASLLIQLTFVCCLITVQAASAAYKGVNVTLMDTIPSTAAAAAAVRSFARGPAIFQPLDLLHNVASRPFQLIVASRGSFVGANTGLYGCDECVHLREGELLWYLAPPDKLDEFRKLFDGNVKEAYTEAKTITTKKAVAVTKASTVHTALLVSHGVHAVHQKAGDTIDVPGGWVRAVKNLSDTVSFGSYYLRAWNLKHTIAFAEEEIEHGRLTADSGCVIDLPAIFDTLQQQARDCDLGISSVVAETAVKAWRESNAYALLGSPSPSTQNRSKRQRVERLVAES